MVQFSDNTSPTLGSGFEARALPRSSSICLRDCRQNVNAAFLSATNKKTASYLLKAFFVDPDRIWS